MSEYPEAYINSECEEHPDKIVVNGIGDYLCLKCADLKVTDRCPRCHHNGKNDHSAECAGCGKDRISTDSVWHDDRRRWAVEPETLGDKFRWHAKQLAFRIGHSRVIPYPYRNEIAHWIYETFLTERRPGHATVIGRVKRDHGPK